MEVVYYFERRAVRNLDLSRTLQSSLRPPATVVHEATFFRTEWTLALTIVCLVPFVEPTGTWWCAKEASMSVRGYLHSCTHATHIYTLNILYIGRVCLFHACNTHTRTRTQNCDYLEFLHRRAIAYTILKSQKK